MSAKVGRQLKSRKERITRRLGQADRTATARPELTAANIRYALADRTGAIAAGGIGAVHLFARQRALARTGPGPDRRVGAVSDAAGGRGESRRAMMGAARELITSLLAVRQGLRSVRHSPHAALHPP